MSTGILAAALPSTLASVLAGVVPHTGTAPLAEVVFALVQPGEYWFLPPICLAIALVSAASHREDLRVILRHAIRAWVLLLIGIALFTLLVTSVFGWLLP